MACHLAVEVGPLIDETILSRDGQRQVRLAIFVFTGDAMSQLPQLTLFPSGRYSQPLCPMFLLGNSVGWGRSAFSLKGGATQKMIYAVLGPR